MSCRDDRLSPAAAADRPGGSGPGSRAGGVGCGRTDPTAAGAANGG
jgi:hypothetical protein